MQVQSLLAVALASIPFILASPAVEIYERGFPTGLVNICTEQNFEGTCALLAAPSGVCRDFPESFQYNVSSISIEQGWNCYFYYVTECNVNSGEWFLPEGNYTQLNPGNDAFASLNCAPFASA